MPNLLAHIQDELSVEDVATSLNGCIALIGPLELCYQVSGNSIDIKADINVPLLGKVTIGEATIDPSHPKVTIGGSVIGYKAEVNVTFDFATFNLEACATYCAPEGKCDQSCASVRIGPGMVMSEDGHKRFVRRSDLPNIKANRFAIDHSSAIDPNSLNSIEILIKTGDDDLRADSEVEAYIKLKSEFGDERQSPNLNTGQGFPGSSTSPLLAFKISPPITIDDIEEFGLHFTSHPHGPETGDNWNMDYIKATATVASGQEYVIAEANGHPAFRFTGDATTWSVPVNLPS